MIQEIIDREREKYDKKVSDRQTKRPAKKRQRLSDIVGRRFEMSAELWGGNENSVYMGVVLGKKSYRQKGKKVDGYRVKWHTGEIDYYTRDELTPCLLPEVESRIEVVGELLFDETKWREDISVMVVEDPDEFVGGLRPATIYRSISKNTSVCLWFGGEEFEGLDGSYTMIDGVLRDSDGVRIEYRSTSLSPDTQTLLEEGDDLKTLVDNTRNAIVSGEMDYDSDCSDYHIGGKGDSKIVLNVD